MKQIKRTILSFSFLFLSQFAFGQEVKKIGLGELKSLISSTENKLHVINFWATWCAPCIEELPAFETAFHTFDPQGVSFTMISLDFPNQLEKRVIPFVEKKSMPQEVVLLDYGKNDRWYDKVEKEWDGAIPITLIFNNAKKQRKIFLGAINHDILEETIQSFLN